MKVIAISLVRKKSSWPHFTRWKPLFSAATCQSFSRQMVDRQGNDAAPSQTHQGDPRGISHLSVLNVHRQREIQEGSFLCRPPRLSFRSIFFLFLTSGQQKNLVVKTMRMKAFLMYFYYWRCPYTSLLQWWTHSILTSYTWFLAGTWSCWWKFTHSNKKSVLICS